MRLPSRRDVLIIGAGVVASGAVALRAHAQSAEAAERHGISSFGDLKYPADFRHFDYVDPKAPKGGMFSQIGPSRMFNQGFLTFNSLNSYILRGDAAQGMELTFASLMVRASDEPDALYGLAARAVRISADGLTYRFVLRPEAKFNDGTRLTAHDVAFSLNVLKDKGHPIITQLLRDFIGAEAADDAIVVLRFKPDRARDVPLFAAGLPIFSRAYYGGRTFDETTLDVPLGSGPYKVGRFEPGRYIEYQRQKDWWGGDLSVSRGQYNFDTVRFEYYRDRDVAFEGFTGRNYLFREEFTSRIWATRYDFPAIKDKRVRREVIADDTPSGAQGWFLNTRLPKFKHPKLREALIYAFDFEWTNKTIMYSSYDRTHSVFQNSEMMAKGKPSAEELALLEPFRGKVPDEVFGEPFVPPVSDGSGADRSMLRRGAQLLNEAGYVIKGGKRIGPNGERISVEFLDRGADLPAASHAVHQEPQHARHRCHGADRRPGADAEPPQRLRLRGGHPAVRLLGDAGRLAALLFLITGGRTERLAEPRRDRGPSDRRHDRSGHRCRKPGCAQHRLPGAGPADPRWPLLDSPLVQGVALDRLLGRVRPPAHQAALRAGRVGNLVVRPREGGQNRAEGVRCWWNSRHFVILPIQDRPSQPDSQPQP